MALSACWVWSACSPSTTAGWDGHQRDIMQAAVDAAVVSLGRDPHERQRDDNHEPFSDEELTERVRGIIAANLATLGSEAQATPTAGHSSRTSCGSAETPSRTRDACVLVGEHIDGEADGPALHPVDPPPFWLSDYSGLGRLGSVSTDRHDRGRVDQGTREAWSIRNRVWLHVQNESANGLLDRLAVRACESTRAMPGTEVEIYAVGFYGDDVEEEVRNAVQAHLERCMGSARRPFRADSAGQLSEVFAEIARGVITVE